MVRKLPEILLPRPDSWVLISCCLAARSSYYHSLLCPPSLGLWGLALPSCSQPSDADSCTGKSHVSCCHAHETQSIRATLDFLPTLAHACPYAGGWLTSRPGLFSACFTSERITEHSLCRHVSTASLSGSPRRSSSFIPFNS